METGKEHQRLLLVVGEPGTVPVPSCGILSMVILFLKNSITPESSL
jgi:hypothetical protein